MWYMYSTYLDQDTGILIDAFQKYCIENDLFESIEPRYIFQVSQSQAEQVIYTEQSSKVKFIVGILTDKIKDYLKARITYLSKMDSYECYNISHDLMTAIKNDEFEDFIHFYNGEDVLELCLVFCGPEIYNYINQKPTPLQLLLTLYNSRQLNFGLNLN